MLIQDRYKKCTYLYNSHNLKFKSNLSSQMSKLNLNQNKIFQNVNGNNIILTINQYDFQNMSVEFIITEKNSNKLYKYFIVLFLLISINIYSFYFQYIPIRYNFTLSILIILFILKITSTVTCEKLLVIKSLGLQVTLIYCTGMKSSIFVPWKGIKKIFINEVITMQRVLFFLTIMAENDDGDVLIPVFKNIRPRLQCLELIYNQIEDIFR